jgi:CHASE3 domain sensor protein
MWEKIKGLFNWILHQWKKVPLRWKGRVSIILPVTAIIISSVFAFLGNRSREVIEADIERKFALVLSYNEVLTLMVNAETGMRGYQLTKREEFLQPFQFVQENLPAKLNAFQLLIEAEPGEKQRIRKTEIFNQIKSLIENQLVDLEWQRQHLIQENGVDQELYNHINNGKKYMDTIRNLLGQMQAEESERLAQRIGEINDIRRRDYLIVFITVLLALMTRILAWYLFNIGINQSIARVIKKLKERREQVGDEIEEVGEMEALEAEVDYLLQKLPNNPQNT